MCGELPVVAVSGSRGKTTVACMFESILRASGRATGMWISSGVYALGARLSGELGPWQRVLLAVRHGELDIAVQEMESATVLGVGLPEGTYPLAVITTICGNNDACLLSQDARVERQAVEAVIRSVRSDGVVVAGADDFDVAEAAAASPATHALFALRNANPVLQRHLRAGGTGAWVENDYLTVGDATNPHRIIHVERIPATLDGALVFQVQNALAAALAAYVAGVAPQHIQVGLSTYTPDPTVQPAACNIFEYNGARIVIDAPKTIWSLRMLMRGIRSLPRRRTMIVSGVFPALPLDDVKDAGRLLGTLGAIVVLHADPRSSERLEALRAGIASAPTLPLVLLAKDETHAIDQMLNKIGADDVALVLASDPERALEHLWPAPVISIDPPARRKSDGKV